MNTYKKISITIPAHNEEKTIEKVVQNAIASVSKITPQYEILLVNDGSQDKTGVIMNRLQKKFKDNIRVIHHKKNKGFTGAMQSCYQNAKGDLIFLGPADGQFNYREVKKFVDEIQRNDIVVAYRIVNNESLRRKLNSFLFHLLSRVLFGIKLREFSSCMLYTKKVRDTITVSAHPFSALFLPEFIYKSINNKFSISQVPIHFYKRKWGGQRGANPKMILKTLSEMLHFWLEIKLGRIR